MREIKCHTCGKVIGEENEYTGEWRLMPPAFICSGCGHFFCDECGDFIEGKCDYCDTPVEDD
jgi:phage FluMu protein Com